MCPAYDYLTGRYKLRLHSSLRAATRKPARIRGVGMNHDILCHELALLAAAVRQAFLDAQDQARVSKSDDPERRSSPPASGHSCGATLPQPAASAQPQPRGAGRTGQQYKRHLSAGHTSRHPVALPLMPSSGVYSRVLGYTPPMERTAMERPCIDDGVEGTRTREEITCDTGTCVEGCWGALPA